MWSPVVLSLLVGLAFASNNPAWTENQEYVYRVRGRTLTGLMEVSDQYTGFLFRATLRIQPKADGQQLQALISESEYTQIHTKLRGGWRAEISEEELSWKPLVMVQKPFQIQMENGKIVNLVVSKQVKNWEANMIKGIVSVFQLNVNGENALPSTLNVLPGQRSNNGVYLAMEDTVSGETETLYEIRPVPEHLVDVPQQSEKIFEHLKQNGEIIEVIKHKNFSMENELPSFVYGFGDYIIGEKPSSNKMGEFFSRDSTGRAILLGNLNRFTVYNSSIVNTILVSPTITDEQKAAVVSIIEANLKEVKSQDEKIGQVPEPVQLGNLVYTYNRGFSEENQVRGDERSSQWRQNERDSDEEYSDLKYAGAYQRFRKPRSIDSYSRDQSFDDEYYYTQNQPKINQAPESPLMAFTTGYEGKSIKKAVNVVKEAEKIAKKIGTELKDSEKDHHERTLERFVTLASLIRLMKFDELKQMSQQLYSQVKEGSEKATWAVLRDAVAEAGTGPALLMIESWIESDKIEGEDAAQVISTMAKAARQPTLEYMKSFYELTKKEKVLRQWPLNDTALVSFGHLARVVYTDKKLSKTQFPVKAFGPFRTQEGKRFIREEVIPYYTEMLKKSIQRAETHKIHAYIHTLGKIADRRILAAFEPFLEGKQQASQFQRFLMVVSLQKLAEVHPEVTRAVLFRVYQNVAEHPAVRIAAVYQIMRNHPTFDILQAMAMYTNIEKNDYVNAAVKHSIEQLSELDESLDSVHEIRKHANLVRSHLTTKNYGLNFASHYVHSYLIDELNEHVDIAAHFIPSEDQYLPKGIRYAVKSSLAGLHNKQFVLQAFASSFDQLTDFAYKQTKSYQKEQEQQREHADEQAQYPWSSQNIAKLLNIKAEEREQLEGFLSLELGVPHRMFGFDNNTIEQLPSYVQKLEQQYRSGQKINMYKLVNNKEMVLAFPTVMGVPFVYHYATPMLIKAQGEVVAVSNPQMSQGSYLQKPEQVKIESVMRITLSGKTQGRISFTAPFESQQYISGYDKHWEINLPQIKTQIKVDLKQKELQIEIQPQQENKINLLHYRTWPYTANIEVTNFEPLTAQSSQKSIKLVKTENMQGHKTVIGDKATGIALEVEINHERKNIHVELLHRIFAQNGLAGVHTLPRLTDGLRALWNDNDIKNSQFDLTYLPEQSSVRKITLRSKYDQDYVQKAESKQSKWTLDEKVEPAQRQQGMIKDVSAEIRNADVYALDNTIKFEGEKNIQYLLSAAVARSDADPKSRARICFKRTSESQELKDYEAHIVVNGRAENTNAMDLEESFQQEPQMDSEIEAVFGFSQEKLSKIKAQLQHRRSEERKQYLKDLPKYKQCKQEMQRGNKALDACTQVNMAANLLDRAEIKIQHENLKPEFEDTIQMAYEAARLYAFPSMVTKEKANGQDKQVLIKLKFYGDLAYLNATVQTQYEQTTFKNIPIDELFAEIVVPHPVFHLRTRVSSQILGLDSYRDFCTVDQTKVSTFSNKTYDADISNRWTVMALYAPKEARDNDQDQQQQYLAKQLKSQLENYVVLVRQNKESQEKKDVKIVVSTPETNYQIVDIEMKPSQGEKAKAKVTVNGKEFQVTQKRSQDYYNGFIQMYALPNGEVKVDIENAFYVIYDGERLRMTSFYGKLKDATRGLCGQFNDNDFEDFLTSENCFARKPQAFVKSYEVEGNEGQQIRKQFAGQDKQCVDKQQPLFVNVITKADSFRDNKQYSQSEDYNSRPKSEGRECLIHQTKYVQLNGEICFTTVPVPSCSVQCHADNYKNKEIGVHCVKKTNVADLWKNQIDNGRSPDFSNKKKHKNVQMPIPQSCSL